MSNSLKLLEITDKNKWNDFVGAQAHAEFLQSWEWGEFQEKVEGKGHGLDWLTTKSK